jgi:Undecaprenyl-phosphate glucose phosphotransferase
MLDQVATDAGGGRTAILGSAIAAPSKSMAARLSRWRLIATLQLAEAFAATTFSCIWLNDLISERDGRAVALELIGFAAAVALVLHLVLRSLCAYDFALIVNPWRSSATAAAAWALSTAPLLPWAIELGSHDRVGQIFFSDWLAGGACIVLIRMGNACLIAVLMRARWLGHNVAIVGSGPEAQACAQVLRSSPGGADVVGFIAPGVGSPQGADAEEQFDTIAQLQQLFQTCQVQEVVVATSERDRDRLPDLVRGLLCLPVRIQLWPQSIGIDPEWIAPSACKTGGVPLILARAPPLEGWLWVLKDGQDRLLALLALIFCLPVLLTITVSIWLSNPGPILFRQEREGYGGRRFIIFKFRTMHVSAPRADQLILTAEHDTRVFPLGAILRKTSLDELPQLFNVLRGDMWLVGPRPHSPLATAAGQPYSAAVKQYMARLRVKPGITGLAQVNGWRGTTNTVEQIQRRVAHDLYYIENWSVWLDFKILLKTAVHGFVHRNAY